MAATTAGALKARIESLGLGLSAFRDEAPLGLGLPYVTIREAVSVRPDPAFNRATDPGVHVSELAQIDLWQQWRDKTNPRDITEDYALASSLYAGLDGVQLTTGPALVFLCGVDSMVRLLEREENLVHHALTVRLRRRLS